MLAWYIKKCWKKFIFHAIEPQNLSGIRFLPGFEKIVFVEMKKPSFFKKFGF